MDNCVPYVVVGFYYDESRHRLVFPVVFREIDYDPTAIFPNNGLWTFDLEDSTIKRAVAIHSPGFGQPRSFSEDKCVVGDLPSCLFLWDPQTDTISDLFSSEPGIMAFPSQQPSANSTVLLNDDLYVGWHRMARHSSPDAALSVAPEKGCAEPFALRVHDGKLIACNEQAVWRLSGVARQGEPETHKINIPSQVGCE